MAKSKTYQVLGHRISGIKCDATGLRRMDVNRPGAKLETARIEMDGTGKACFSKERK